MQSVNLEVSVHLESCLIKARPKNFFEATAALWFAEKKPTG